MYELASFIPRPLQRRLARRGSPPHDLTVHPAAMAVLFADVSGSTKLAEDLAREGAVGPERLTSILDRLLAALIDPLALAGGEVVSFSGDALTAVWESSDDESLPMQALRAVRCGLDLQSLARRLPELRQRQLSLRIAVAAGEGAFLEVGGYNGRWSFVVAGEPAVRLQHAAGVALPGEVVVDANAWSLLAEPGAGVRRGETIVAEQVPAPPPFSNRPSSPLEEALITSAWAYVPRAVVERTASGQPEWWGEFRNVNALFVNLIEPGSNRALEPAAIHRSVQTFQTVMDGMEGSLDKVLVDDKGATLIGCFGLPPLAHEDDPLRAVETAMRLAEGFRVSRQEFGVGLASGRAFCGAYGSDHFRQYTAIGPVMNRAATLMMSARNEILCDDRTVRASSGRIRFSALGPVLAKDGTRLEVAKPLWLEAINADTAHSAGELIGRQDEMRELNGLLGAMVHAGGNSVVEITGEPGIGKSMILRELIASAKGFGVRPLVSRGDAVGRSVPYLGWRSVLLAALDLAGTTSPEARRRKATAQLAHSPGVAELLPLLDPVLELGLADTELTAPMRGAVRRDALGDLVVALLDGLGAPMLIAFDDAQWLDSASVDLAQLVVRKVSSVMLALARPDASDPLAPELQTTYLRLELGPLQPAEALAMVCRRLGVERLPEAAERIIIEKGGGHPLFSEELGYALRDQGIIGEEDGGRGFDSSARLQVPETVDGLVAARLDRLELSETLTLKAASVIGQTFTSDLLSTLRRDLGGEAVESDLKSLVRAGLLAEEGGRYAFRHALIRESVYEMVSFETRGQAHALLASRLAEEPEPSQSVLAHHWEAAGEIGRAISCLEIAGAEALDRGAGREAVSLFRRALELAGAPPDPDERARQAHWHGQIGVASVDIGDLTAASHHYGTALGLLRVLIPRQKYLRLLAILWEVLLQAFHLLVPRDRRPRQGLRLGQAARVCSLLGELDYFMVDSVGFVLHNLVSINLAERAGRPSAAGLAYSSLSYLARVVRLPRLAARYNDAAERAENEAERMAREGGRTGRELPGHAVAAANSRGSYLLCFNRWDEAFAALDAGIESCRRRRDHYTLNLGLSLRAQARTMAAPLDLAMADLLDLRTSAGERGNNEHLAWALGLAPPVLRELGRHHEADEWSMAAVEHLEVADAATIPLLHGARAVALLRAREQRRGRSQAERALDAIGTTPIFPQLVAYTASLDTLLTLWEEHRRSRVAPDAELARLVRRAVRRLRLFARILPFARPRAALFRGWQLRLAGHNDRAIKVWEHGIEVAVAAGLHWDEGRLREMIAESLPAGERRDEMLMSARQSFTSIRAEGAMRRLRG